MSDNQGERRSVSWFNVFHPNGTKISVTFRGPVTREEMTEDLRSFFDAVELAEATGFRFTPTGSAPTVELSSITPRNYKGIPIAEIREIDAWVRAKSRKGHDCIYGYVNGLNLKRVTFYDSLFSELPITQEEFDGAAIWTGGLPPEADQAIEGGYMNEFPARVRVAMYDTGEFFGENKILNPDQIVGSVSKGLKGSDKPANAPTSGSAPKNANVPINSGSGQCPDCNAPAGKPHASSCPRRDGGSNVTTDPTQIPGVVKGVDGVKKSPSRRQKLAAALMLLGQHEYGDGWDQARASAVKNLTDGRTDSVSELTDEEIETLVSSLRESIELQIDSASDFAAFDLAQIIADSGYTKPVAKLSSLPSEYLVKVSKVINAMVDAAEQAEPEDEEVI